MRRAVSAFDSRFVWKRYRLGKFARHKDAVSNARTAHRKGNSGMNRISSRGWKCIVLGIGALAGAGVLRGQEPPKEEKEDYVKAHYTKYEYRIPMRDGKKLFTSVYVPKDASQPYPILMDRTPYNVAPYGEDQYKKHLGPSDEFEKAGYIFAYQDVRGRYMSEGEFVEMRPHLDIKKSPSDVDDSTDTYDTIEFLLKHVPNNNGKVGVWGISYPGFYTSASIIDSHPALKAASPQAPMTDLFLTDDAYHGGTFMLAANFGFYTSFRPFPEPTLLAKVAVPFDFGTPDGYDFFLRAGSIQDLKNRYLKESNPLFNDQMAHTTYDDYWKARDLSRHMKNIKCAVMAVGGWFDAEDLSGPFKTFHAIEQNNPGIANSLVVGPWVHGGWAITDGDHLGDVQFAAKTSDFFRANIQLPFFEYYLKGKSAAIPKAYVFETGTNVWRKYDAWPPPQAKTRTLYLHAGGKLSFEPPSEKEGFDEYVSDPAHPVPFVNYISASVPQRYMVDDQRFAARRPDVLGYQSEPLEEDVTLAGPVSPKLRVASTGTDSDFVVKLIDVSSRRLPGQRRHKHDQESSGSFSGSHGRVPAALARRAHARKVPEQLGKTRTAESGQIDCGGFHDAGRISHLPEGAPDHGADPKLLVSPRGSQSANLNGNTVRQTRGFQKSHRRDIS
jgi:putative CocE/NonD family hydrolase